MEPVAPVRARMRRLCRRWGWDGGFGGLEGGCGGGWDV